MVTCGASGPTCCSRSRAPSPSVSPRVTSAARSTRPRCASSCGCSSARRARWSTRAARDVVKAPASGAPTGAVPTTFARRRPDPLHAPADMLTPETLPALQRALAEADLDGWLLYDFQGNNPIANGLLALQGMVSRRVFVLVPREGVPRALGHAIESGPWQRWPAHWPRTTYSAWRELEAAVAELVRGKRIAMEYSAGDAVPYL